MKSHAFRSTPTYAAASLANNIFSGASIHSHCSPLMASVWHMGALYGHPDKLTVARSLLLPEPSTNSAFSFLFLLDFFTLRAHYFTYSTSLPSFPHFPSSSIYMMTPLFAIKINIPFLCLSRRVLHHFVSQMSHCASLLEPIEKL